MKGLPTIHRLEEISALPRVPRAVALGLFDGVHIGHRAVISRAAGAGNTRATVFTFSHPSWSRFKANAGELLSDEERVRVLATLGVEEIIEADLAAIQDMSPEAFVREILHERLDARRVCCGFNFHFGKGGAGDAAMLTRLCEPYGIAVSVVDAVQLGGEPVSSSRIRRCIEQGDMRQAARLLGRPFTLDREVVGGQHLGRMLGTPTINQTLPESFVRPRFGVYASSVVVDGAVHYGVTNIGVRPTVGAAGPLAETWIPGYSGDLYGQSIPVSPVKFLREEQKFPSVEALQAQILRDAQAAKRAVCGDPAEGVRAVLFDFDDTLQNRGKAFLGYTEYFLDTYFPGLPVDEREARRQEMLRRNNGGYVPYLEFFGSLLTDWGRADVPAEAAYREYQLRFPEHVCLLDDAVPVLQELRRRGYFVGVITNGPSVLQNRKLDLSGLRPYLDLAMVSSDEGVHKPDPELFRRAASRLGVACESCVYVGDHPVNDVQGAKAAAMRPVYMRAFGQPEDVPDVPEIHSLTELLALL